MSLRITDECINCGSCQEACPTAAISEDPVRNIRVIDAELCTECVGFYGRTMCLALCPIECIETAPGDRETEPALFEKAKALFPCHDFPSQPPSHLR